MAEYYIEIIPEEILVTADCIEQAKEKARRALLESTLDLWITRNYSDAEFSVLEKDRAFRLNRS